MTRDGLHILTSTVCSSLICSYKICAAIQFLLIFFQEVVPDHLLGAIKTEVVVKELLEQSVYKQRNFKISLLNYFVVKTYEVLKHLMIRNRYIAGLYVGAQTINNNKQYFFIVL